MKTVLMVLPGATVWTMKNKAPHPTGFCLEEQVGLTVKGATPGSVKPTVAPLSFYIAPNNGASAIEAQKEHLQQVGDVLKLPLTLED